MNETSKLRAILTEEEWHWFDGHGIDIGCGPDPIFLDCVHFDKEDGDAEHITDYVHQQFDWVYASHCLEHMTDPVDALNGWWSLVRPGGYLIALVPDEDLYEQGTLKHFNSDHKHTFTISKRVSWSPVSINVLDLVRNIKDSNLIKLELQDIGLDRRHLSFGRIDARDFTLGDAMAQIMFVLQKKLTASPRAMLEEQMEEQVKEAREIVG